MMKLNVRKIHLPLLNLECHPNYELGHYDEDDVVRDCCSVMTQCSGDHVLHQPFGSPFLIKFLKYRLDVVSSNSSHQS